MKPYLADPMHTRAVLNRYELTARKQFGQNFLIDPHVAETILETAGVGKDDCVLEIGPGIGTLTQYLAEAAGKVVAVELDHKLIPVLEDTLSFWHNVTVIQGDILKQDLAELAERENGGRPFKVVANLPYYITTPILMKLLSGDAPIGSITVMVQAEMARRMQAGPGGKDYGSVSLAVQYYAEPRIAARVTPDAFMPQPGVDSAVLHLTKREKPPVETDDPGYMFDVIKGAFLQRRKMLANALQNQPSLRCSREDVTEALGEMGLSPQIRGEVLTLAEFAELSGRIRNITTGRA